MKCIHPVRLLSSAPSILTSLTNDLIFVAVFDHHFWSSRTSLAFSFPSPFCFDSRRSSSKLSRLTESRRRFLPRRRRREHRRLGYHIRFAGAVRQLMPPIVFFLQLKLAFFGFFFFFDGTRTRLFVALTLTSPHGFEERCYFFRAAHAQAELLR
jgi:hypothetical protein